MKIRKQINYEDIVEIGKNLIKEQTDFLWETDKESERTISAYVISGIVDFLDSLDKATRMTQEEIDKAIKEFKNNPVTNLYMDSEDLNKHDKSNCCRE